jgi:hypothetical protein
MAFNQIIGYIKERGDINKVEEKYIPHNPSCAASAAAVKLTFDNMFGKLTALARICHFVLSSGAGAALCRLP